MKFIFEKSLFIFIWLAGAFALAYFYGPSLGFGFLVGFITSFLILVIMAVVDRWKEPEQYS
jgi:hypothetical protein